MRRLRRVGFLLFGLAACLPTASCRPAAEDAAEVIVEWTVEPSPPAIGPATLSLTLIDHQTRQPVRGAAVRLEGGMTHPGMPPLFAAAHEMSPGRYLAPLHLTMAGDWFVLVEATLRDGRAVRRQLDLPGVRAR